MSEKKNIQALNDASKKKRTDTMKRVMEALKTMENEDIPINFLSVSNFTGVARSWLYTEPTVKNLITLAKKPKNNQLMGDQAIKLKSKNREIDILSKQNKLLRQQIDELRKQLEVAYAEIYRKDET